MSQLTVSSRVYEYGVSGMVFRQFLVGAKLIFGKCLYIELAEVLDVPYNLCITVSHRLISGLLKVVPLLLIHQT